MKQKLVKKYQEAVGLLVGYLQIMEELNSGLPNSNPSSGMVEDLNPEPPNYKSSVLTTSPRCLLT